MAINLTIEQVKVLLKKSGQTISQENRAGNNLGTVLKLANGCNVNCWDKGTVNCQGKNVSEIEKLLSAPTTGIPQNNKVFVVYGHDKNASQMGFGTANFRPTSIGRKHHNRKT